MSEPTQFTFDVRVQLTVNANSPAEAEDALDAKLEALDGDWTVMGHCLLSEVPVSEVAMEDNE